MGRRLRLAATILVLSPWAARLPAESAPTIGIDEITRGQTGYGESVFVGTEPERFGVEVLGVLRDIGPDTSYILARLSGHNLERTGVIAGMSGSPVWIDGRLAGAVAFSWSFAQEAIAGITPIAAMRGIPESAPWSRGDGAPRVAWSDLVARRLPADPFAGLAASAGAATGLGARPGWEWSASGFAPRTLDRLGAALAAGAPSSGGRVDEVPGALVPGSSIAAVFLDGDFRLAATGTLTDRDGDRVLAFGHPIAGLGAISLPLAPAEVITVLGSNQSSFKIANSGPIVGVFERDHAAGTLGRLGVVPQTVPLEVTISSPQPRSFSMRLARVKEVLPALTAVGTYGALDAVTAAGGVEGLDLHLALTLESGERVALRQSFDGPDAASRLVSFLFSVVDYVARNDLSPVEVSAIDVELVPHAEPRVATLVDVQARPRKAEAGAPVELVLELKGYREAISRRTLRIDLPADLDAGRYSLFVGDAATIDGVRFALAPVEPRDLGQAIGLLESLGSSREIAVLGIAAEPAVTAGGETLSRLPPSVRAIWSGAAAANRPLRSSIVQSERFASEKPVSGAVRLDLEIVRPETVGGERSGTPARPARRSNNGNGRRGSRR